MAKTVKKDQGELIQLLRDKKIEAAWQKVIQIGIDIYKDMSQRKFIFYEVVEKFDPYRNNNFILFYRNGLSQYKSAHNTTFKGTYTPKINKQIIREQISPSLDDDPKLTNSETVQDVIDNWA